MRETPTRPADPSPKKRGARRAAESMAVGRAAGKAPTLPRVPQLQGHIEQVTADGFVRGWVRDAADPVPCHLQIWHFSGDPAEQVVAECYAADFRPDLLRVGMGHGHHGFAARLRRNLPEGTCQLALHLPRYGLTAPITLSVPAMRPVGPTEVEDLLVRHSGWKAEDVLARPDCLHLEANLAAQGSARFVDGLYRFLFARWPSKAESATQVLALERGFVTPRALFLELLQSREQADLTGTLASPYDPEFPFTLA